MGKKSHKRRKNTRKKNKKPDYIGIAVAAAFLCIIVVAAAYLYLGQEEQGDVAALVNGEQIMVRDVHEMHNALQRQYPNITYAEALNQSIYLILLQQESHEQQIRVEDSIIDEIYEAQLEMFLSQIGEEELQERIKQANLTMESFRENLRESIRQDRTIAALLKANVYDDIEVTDAEAWQAYNASLAGMLGDTISARHILICYQGAERCTHNYTKGQAQELITKVREQFNGSNFQELAQQYSTGPSASKGGDLGTFARNTMVPEFEDVAFALEVGEISDPVETVFGYHLILVTGKQDAPSFDEAKEDMVAQIRAQKGKADEHDYVLSLYEDAQVEILVGT
ncbi:MAG: peptidylprolyl isomerase [Nanoarchaeota archaeon]